MRHLVRIAVQLLLLGYLVLLAMIIVPSFLGIQVDTVLSGSMEPAIQTGSVIYARPAAFSDIQRGDIITFRLEGSGIKVTHRVTEKDEAGEFLVTKGDANQEPDARPVRYQEVLGTVQCAVPYLGRLAVLLTRNDGKLLLLCILLLLSGLEELLGRRDIR